MATPVQINDLAATALFVRGGSCKLLGYSIYNPSNAAAYVQFFDTLLGPTVGTTAPKWSIALATLTSQTLNTVDLFFRDGLWVAATTTDDGSSAPSAALNVSLELS